MYLMFTRVRVAERASANGLAMTKSRSTRQRTMMTALAGRFLTVRCAPSFSAYPRPASPLMAMRALVFCAAVLRLFIMFLRLPWAQSPSLIPLTSADPLSRVQPTIDGVDDDIDDEQDADEDEDGIAGSADEDLAVALDFETDRRSSLNTTNDADMSQEL
jgi:hypothetical protein